MQSAPTSAQEDTARPDIEANAQSVGRHLRGGNKAPAAIHSYLDAVTRLDAFLTTRGMPRSVGSLHREHVEAYAEDQLSRLKPASAAKPPIVTAVLPVARRRGRDPRVTDGVDEAAAP